MAVLSWLLPGRLAPISLVPNALSLSGGFAFGVGAALNGGCAVSTVTRLGNGELRMLVTILGMIIAIGAIDGSPYTAEASVQSTHALVLGGLWLKLAVGALIGWSVWEATKLWRGRDRACGLIEGLLHHRWRLSLAAAVIGVSNVGISAIAGHWAYTSTLRDAIDSRLTAQRGLAVLPIFLFAALMTGVIVSAVMRGTCALRCRPKADWARNFFGGLLMGSGIATIPGGNDGLLLDAIPSLSPHALPAFVALLIGVATLLLPLRRLSDVPPVDCGGDICRER